MSKFSHKTFLILGIILVCSFSVKAWEALPHPGGTPKQIFIKEPGRSIIVGSFWYGFFNYDLQTETWSMPTYGPECCNGGLATEAIATPFVGSDTMLVPTCVHNDAYDDFPVVLRSFDGGLSWQRADSGITFSGSPRSNIIAFNPFNNRVALWGGNPNHIYKTEDYGETWVEMPSSIGKGVYTMTFSQHIKELLLVGTTLSGDTTMQRGILRRTREDEAPKEVWPTDPDNFHRPMSINKIVEDPFDPANWMMGLYDGYIRYADQGECLWTSNDTGKTWQLQTEGLLNVYNVDDIIADFHTPGRFWITDPSNGVFRSDDGGESWHPDNEGLGQTNCFQYLVQDPLTGALFVNQYLGDVYCKPSFDEPWQPLPPNPYDSTYPTLSLQNDKIITQNSLGLFISSPPPAWEPKQLNKNLFEDNGVRNHINVAINENDTQKRAVFSMNDWNYFDFKVHVTKDDGETWTEWCEDTEFVGYPHYAEFLTNDTLYVVDIIDGSILLIWEDGSEMLAGPFLGYISDVEKEGNDCLFNINGYMYWSDDRGITRHLLPQYEEINSINHFAGDPTENGEVIGTSRYYVYGSRDGGRNWFESERPSTGYMGCTAYGGGHMYIAAQGADMIYAREGFDNDWFALDEGWPEGFLPIMIKANDEFIIVAGGANRPNMDRFYYCETPVAGQQSGWRTLPSNYTLHDPYPNPFNATTTISFTLPEPSHVNITVTNLNGRKVATLTDKEYAFGKYNVHWDASRLASGTYIISMKTQDGTNMTKKVQLIK